MKTKKKRAPEYARRKTAFDRTMEAYRNADTLRLGAVHFNPGSAASRYEAKPTAVDYRCDVERVLNKCIKTIGAKFAFMHAYILYDSVDPIDIEIHAQKLLGDRRHGLEQGIGAEFIRRHIYPTRGKKGYFTAIRKQRVS